MSGNHDSNAVTVTLDGLTVALLLSSILYIFCLVLVKRKLYFLHRISPELGTKKLLVLSVGLVCAIRLMSFIGVAAMDVANVREHYSLKPIDDSGSDTGGTITVEDRNQNFYDGAMTVLFDLPNCIVVSTYVLLTLVWAECFLVARFHTENTIKWRTRWLWAYMLFNAALYGTQMILYILIFWSVSSKVVRTVLYAAMTGVNFAAVFLVAVLYVYLSVKFSGFPFRSPHSRTSLGKISSLMALWSIARLLWGVAMLLIFIFNVELLQNTTTSAWQFLCLFLLFVVCEIIPIIAMLDYSYMTIIGFERNTTDIMFESNEPLLSLVDTSDTNEKNWHNHSHSLFGDSELRTDSS